MVFIQAKGYTKGRASPLTHIVIHHWGAPGQAHDNVVRHLAENGATSAHYVVSAGRVTQLVADGDTAWHAKVANAKSIGIECRPEATGGDYAEVAALVVALRAKYGPLILARHSEFVATECPGVWDLGRLEKLSKRENMGTNGLITATELSVINWASTGPQRALWFVARDFEAMAQAAKTAGHSLNANEGYRDLARQREYWTSPKYGPRVAAYPGTSNHGWGIAIDIGGLDSFDTAAYKWMQESAWRYGFSQPPYMRRGGSKPEPWHWEHLSRGIVYQPIKATAASGGTTPTEGIFMALSDQDQNQIKAAADRILGTALDIRVLDKPGGIVEVVPAGTAGSRPARNLTDADGNFLVQLIQAQNQQIGALQASLDKITAKVGA